MAILTPIVPTPSQALITPGYPFAISPGDGSLGSKSASAVSLATTKSAANSADATTLQTERANVGLGDRVI